MAARGQRPCPALSPSAGEKPGQPPPSLAPEGGGGTGGEGSGDPPPHLSAGACLRPSPVVHAVGRDGRMGAGSVPTRMCSRDLGGVGAVPGSSLSVLGLPVSCGGDPGDWAGPGQALGWDLHSLPALSRQTEALLTICRRFDLCGRGGTSLTLAHPTPPTSALQKGHSWGEDGRGCALLRQTRGLRGFHSEGPAQQRRRRVSCLRRSPHPRPSCRAKAPAHPAAQRGWPAEWGSRLS